MKDNKISVRKWIEENKDNFNSKEELIKACVKVTGKAEATARIQYGKVMGSSKPAKRVVKPKKRVPVKKDKPIEEEETTIKRDEIVNDAPPAGSRDDDFIE